MDYPDTEQKKFLNRMIADIEDDLCELDGAAKVFMMPRIYEGEVTAFRVNPHFINIIQNTAESDKDASVTLWLEEVKMLKFFIDDFLSRQEAE